MAEVRFSVLGRMAVEVDGADIRIPGRRERAVLALLLAARGRVVPVGRLLEDIWGESPAPGAHASLQVAVSRLRSLVEPERAPRSAPTLLVSSGPGYTLLAAPDAVDSERFGVLVAGGHAALQAGDAVAALALCEEADRIWTGTAYADVVESDLVEAERRRLEDLRGGAHEIRAEALLDLGRHALVTGEMEGLVATYPFRERLWRHYALALYRSGRQAEALETLRRARALLLEELGVDPSPELQQLEADLLSHAPGLVAETPGRPPHAATRQRADALGDPGEPGALGARGGRPEHGGADLVGLVGLVGRDDALAQLDRSLRAAVVDGRGSTVVVSGEAGIGKTRLVTELAGRAEREGARLLWGRCHEADASPAYWPWVPIVRDLVGTHPSREISDLLESGAGTETGDAGAAALRTYDAVSRLVSSAAEDGPVVLVLEDVHWADAASLQLLAYLAETLPGTPVLLVATVRTVESPSESLQACLAALGRARAARVTLRGLPSEEVRTLVGRLTGTQADDELTEVVSERTDGNPFFVIELVRLLESSAQLDAAGAREVPVPHGVQDVLRLRLARLPESVRTLLSVAAVAGRGFDLGVLAEVAGLSRDEVLDLLDTAVASHAVEEGDVPGRFRFAHALVRETLYATLSLARRGLLHAAVARALEPGLANDPDLVAELAHHFVLGAAMRPELAEAAVRHSASAARQAERRGALDQALVHWEQALTADTAAPAKDARRRYDVLVGLGQARSRRADIAGSREALGAAVDIARSLGDGQLTALAATSFRGAGVWHWREFGTSDPAMVAVLEACAGSCPPGPLRTRVLVSLAMELVYQWRSDEAEEVGERAVASAREFADDALFADVVALHALVLCGKPGSAPRRLELVDEALARSLSQEQELYLRFNAAVAHLQVGHVAEADQQMTRCRELSRRLRHTGADIPLAWWRFFRAVDAGDEGAARRLLDEATNLHRQSSLVATSDMGPMARMRLGSISDQDADACARAGRNHANPAYRAVAGHALAEVGRADEGADLLGEPVPEGAWDYASMYGDCLRVDVLAAAGRTDELRVALARITPWGHEFAIFGSIDCIGSISYFIGRGLEGLGELDAATTAYAKALTANRTAGLVPWERRAEQRLAALSVSPPAGG